MELGELTVHNVKQLRLLNSVIFPVSYNDKVRARGFFHLWLLAVGT